MQPNGLNIVMGPDGPKFQTTQITRADDAIWNAVEEAIAAGMSARDFRIEAAQAWEQMLRDQARVAQKELMR